MMLYGLPSGVNFVFERRTGRDIQFDDRFFAEAIEPHDECPEAIAMCGDDDIFPGLEVGQDVRLVVRQNARCRIFEAFTVRWVHIIAAPPYLDLRLTKLLRRFFLIQTLKIT